MTSACCCHLFLSRLLVDSVVPCCMCASEGLRILDFKVFLFLFVLMHAQCNCVHALSILSISLLVRRSHMSLKWLNISRLPLPTVRHMPHRFCFLTPNIVAKLPTRWCLIQVHYAKLMSLCLRNYRMGTQLPWDTNKYRPCQPFPLTSSDL